LPERFEFDSLSISKYPDAELILFVVALEEDEAQHLPEGNPGANLESISNRCHPILVGFAWDLT
jgi:hypothetical protein